MIGTRLSKRYELLREIGRGGMGTVYLAYDPLLEREVAIKVVTPSLLSPESVERFKREGKIIAKMDHPGIVVVYDVGEHEQSLYFVMPFVRGTNLRTFMEDRSLTLGEVINTAIQVAEALEYSHGQGVIHRDIKPENIMISREDPSGSLRVRVTDFGLAVASSETRLTQSGAMVGTVAYFSPEQISGGQVTARSDIYSLATVLYECIVGDTPFTGEIQHVLYRILHENAESPRTLGKEIDEELETIILQCLEKDPDSRPANAKELAERLIYYRSRLETADQNRLMLSTSESVTYHKPVLPFIGRTEEFAELQRKLNESIKGECQFVVISGEPGVGKSRILEELENLCRARKIRVLHGRFVEQDRSFPYQGFCEAIQQAVSKSSSSSSPSADLADLTSELSTLFPVLSEIDSRSGSTSSTSVPRSFLTSEARKLEDRTYIFELLARTFTRIGEGRPLVLLLEDLHAAEVSVEALQYIVRRLGSTPAFIVSTYRSTEVDKSHPVTRMINSFQSDTRFSKISLSSFGAKEHRLFLEALTHSEKLQDSLAETLFHATEGNPFFTKELVRSMVDAGSIRKNDEGTWYIPADTSVTTESLPSTIQMTIEKRLERLEPDLKELLTTASILGKSFEWRDLENLAETKDKEDLIDELIKAGFIEEEGESRGDRMRFSSGVLRDVLYRQISRRKRRSLHRKYAEFLEQRYAHRTERVYPQLLHHYSEGDVTDKIIEYGLKLSKKSLDTFWMDEALRALRSVLEALEEKELPAPEIEAHARLMLADALRMTGNVGAALKEFPRVLEIYESLQDPILLSKTLAFAAETAWAGRKVEETRNFVKRGLALKTDNQTRIQLLSLGATVANLRGEKETSREYLQELELIEPAAKETSEEAVEPGGTLHVAMLAPIQALYPAVATLDEEHEILANVFETLVAADERGNLLPNLCEHWESKEGGRKFLFALRSNIRTHQHQRLVAPGCKSAFEKAIQLSKSQLPPAFASIEGVSDFLSGKVSQVSGICALSDDQLEIQLNEPLPIYPAFLTDIRTGVALEQDTPVGTGPFRIASFSPERVLLERTKEYWKNPPALLDSIEFITSMTSAQIASGFRKGEFDLVRDLRPADLDEILRDKRLRAKVAEVPKKNVYFVLFNCNRSLGQQEPVRKAICGILNTRDLVSRALGRSAQPAEGLIPPGILGHDPDRRRHPLQREKVIQLLESSKLKPPLHFIAAVHPAFQDRYEGFLKVLLKALSDIGVEISIITSSINEYLECRLNPEEVDVLIGRFIADYDDPDNFSHGFFHSKAGLYRNYFSLSTLDSWMQEARGQIDPLTRESLYRKIEAYLAENSFVLPLFHDMDLRLANPRIRRFTLRSCPPYVSYSEIGKATAAVYARKTEGGTPVVPITGEIQTLDPSMAFLVSQLEILPAVFETLTREAEGARIVPWLASIFQSEAGGRRFRFVLRENLRFHNGKKLTASDVRYSFERLLKNKESPSRWPLTPISGSQRLMEGHTEELEGFHIVSAHEFTIELDQPLTFFPTLLAYPSAAILPESCQTLDGNWKDGCIGTGPFRVVRFEPGVRLELEANPQYWRQPYPRSDGLVYRFRVTPQEILEGFRKGTYSLAWDLYPSDVEALRRETELGSRYGETPRLSTYYVVFNIHHGPLQDESLRHLLVQAVDVESLVRRTLGRLAIPAHGLIPPGLLGHVPGMRNIPAPVSTGPEIHDELNTIINSVYEGPYSSIAQELLKIFGSKGFAIRNREQTRSEYFRALASATADIVITRWIADYPDPDTFLTGLLHTEKGIVGRVCGTTEMDRLIEQGRSETDSELRNEIYRDAEDMIAKKALLLPLFHEQAYCFARPEVEGFQVTFSRTIVPYEKLWLSR
ncbi:ABC transporter substrate-binding protein [bacterium]|nr:ABC transporter substrate-binding protein [bacterium]